MAQVQANHEICINNLNVAVQAEKDPPEEIDPPQSTIYSMEEVELGKSNSLICFVNNFFPPLSK
uniref:Immunoglobulin C1-set domain-containing protein n=1 Tax=Anguilla anguilla TaxID=7936 RepID=A0A0E9XYE5_ANGAN